jgi:transcriptional regulator with XRE-family HTH domain
MTLGERLKKRVKELEISMRDAAERCGLSLGYFSQLCNDLRGSRLGFETAQKLKAGLQLDDDFFSGTNRICEQVSSGLATNAEGVI